MPQNWHSRQSVRYADALRRAVVVSASIGAGHDGAARELARRLRRHGFVVEWLDFLDLLPSGWGTALRGFYNRQLRYAPASWGWLLNAAAAPRARYAASALAASAAVPRLAAALGPRPAVVVSTYPLASQALGRMRTVGTLTTPVAAIMTDPSVHPLCVADGVDLHMAPSEASAAEIRAWPSAETMVVRPLVDPAFRPSRGLAEACEARDRLGLPLVDQLAVVVAGSCGVGDIDGTVRDLAAAGTVTPVVVCGRNESLRQRLARTGPGIVRGWI